LPRLYGKLIIALTVPFLALNVAARALGSTQPPNPVLEGFAVGCEGKPQPCWYGIVPGVTTVIEIDTILKDLGFSFVEELPYMHNVWRFSYRYDVFKCSVFVQKNLQDEPFESESVKIDCLNMRLGDLILIIGTPQTFYLTGWNFKDEKLIAGLQFISTDLSKCLDFMPNAKVDYVELGSHSFFIYPQSSSDNRDISWHGFMPYTQYVKLYRFPSCELINMLP
jgi:hypothetical protein